MESLLSGLDFPEFFVLELLSQSIHPLSVIVCQQRILPGPVALQTFLLRVEVCGHFSQPLLMLVFDPNDLFLELADVIESHSLDLADFSQQELFLRLPGLFLSL